MDKLFVFIGVRVSRITDVHERIWFELSTTRSQSGVTAGKHAAQPPSWQKSQFVSPTRSLFSFCLFGIDFMGGIHTSWRFRCIDRTANSLAPWRVDIWGFLFPERFILIIYKNELWITVIFKCQSIKQSYVWEFTGISHRSFHASALMYRKTWVWNAN